VERRDHPRRAFAAIQRIAPYSGCEFPVDSEFFEVRCHDLTQSGFSFFLPDTPDFSSLVAAFGTSPNVIWVGAEVRHCKHVLRHPSGLVEYLGDRAGRVGDPKAGGEVPTPMILVGCRFTRRLNGPSPSDR